MVHVHMADLRSTNTYSSRFLGFFPLFNIPLVLRLEENGIADLVPPMLEKPSCDRTFLIKIGNLLSNRVV